MHAARRSPFLLAALMVLFLAMTDLVTARPLDEVVADAVQATVAGSRPATMQKLVVARLHRDNDPAQPLYEVEGQTIYLNLHEGQLRAWNSPARTVAMIAGTQGGKTSFGPWWLHREIGYRGGGDYIAATASFDLFKLKMLPAIREVFEGLLGIGRYWSGDKVLELADPETGQFWASRADDRMWGRIILRSAVAKGGLESATAKGAWQDEAGQDEFELGAREAIKRRLALMRGRDLITTTPYNLGWLKQEIADRDGQGIEVINFDSTANPVFPQAEFEEAERTMQAWKFRMFYRGLFDRPAGMIYANFVDAYREEGGHKIRPFDLPVEWPRFVGVDPGAVNTAKIWLAEDVAKATFYLYRESLEGGKSSAQHAQHARDLAAEHHERVVAYHVGQKSETQQRLDWADGGVPNVKEPPFHDVESGIDKVFLVLGQHRLLIFDSCKLVLDQLGTYRRKLDPDGNVTREIKDKAKYHLLDALRYVIVGVVKPDAPAPSKLTAVAKRPAPAPQSGLSGRPGLGLIVPGKGKRRK